MPDEFARERSECRSPLAGDSDDLDASDIQGIACKQAPTDGTGNRIVGRKARPTKRPNPAKSGGLTSEL
jgi:hypothetical protein